MFPGSLWLWLAKTMAAKQRVLVADTRPDGTTFLKQAREDLVCVTITLLANPGDVALLNDYSSIPTSNEFSGMDGVHIFNRDKIAK